MTTTERTRLITAVAQRRDALSQAFAPLIAIFRNHDFPLWEEAWKTFDAYLEKVAAEIGDRDGWLHWFIYENDCGRKKMQARAAAWSDLRPIATPRALACLLEADLHQP